MPRLTLQEEIVVNAVLEHPEWSNTKIAKHTKIPLREVGLLLQREVVLKAIEEKRQEISGNTLVNVKRVIEEELCIAFADPADLCDQNGNFLPLNKLPERIRRAISRVEVFQKGDTSVIKYQFSDKGKALERIGRHLGMYEKDNTQKQGRIIFVKYDEAKDYIDITPEPEQQKPASIPQKTLVLTD